MCINFKQSIIYEMLCTWDKMLGTLGTGSLPPSAEQGRNQERSLPWSPPGAQRSSPGLCRASPGCGNAAVLPEERLQHRRSPRDIQRWHWESQSRADP